MFDGLRSIHFFDVTSNARNLPQVEVQDDCRDYSEIREPCARPVTSCDAAHDFEFGAKNPIGRRRSVSFFAEFFFLRAARHPADSDGMFNRWCPGTDQGTKGTMASVPLWASTELQSAVSL